MQKAGTEDLQECHPDRSRLAAGVRAASGRPVEHDEHRIHDVHGHEHLRVQASKVMHATDFLFLCRLIQYLAVLSYLSKIRTAK